MSRAGQLGALVAIALAAAVLVPSVAVRAAPLGVSAPKRYPVPGDEERESAGPIDRSDIDQVPSPSARRNGIVGRESSGNPHWLVPTLHSASVILGMRLAVSAIWPQAFDPTRVSPNFSTFRDSWSSPPAFDSRGDAFAWDGDPWALNLFGHGLFGSEIYLRYRQHHHPVWMALTMSALWSSFWEYGLESWHKRPSLIDLVWTPIGGFLLGEARFQCYQRVRGWPVTRGRHILLYLLDPLSQLERDLMGLSH